jgi:hypothetical protein
MVYNLPILIGVVAPIKYPIGDPLIPLAGKLIRTVKAAST